MGSATGGGMGILRYKVRAWRKAAEMTQADLALATGKTVQTISALERGRPTRQSTLDAVARVFGVTPEALRSDPPTVLMSPDEIEALATTGRILSAVAQMAAGGRDIRPLYLALQKMKTASRRCQTAYTHNRQP
ncbi:helix-turn-helix transcriptional regulator [Agrobacterium vitis]|uniref:helix-turn-helix transcriptional regulator n=1 Tax=Agrobacterium vitis TaxID=373 RepID=UPI002ADE7458|nr:helix-turn-helix transcriptional regulator [Agrobacterium vitis]